MTRTHMAARGALALVFGALVACDNNTNGDIVGPTPVNPIFKSYVALGNSITAGFQSDGINDSTQKQSYALLLARSMGTRYAFPSLAMPGCRPPINNFLTQSRVTLAGQPASTAATCLFRSTSSITAALNNVAVPAITSADPTVQAPIGQKSNPLEQFILGGESMVQRALDAHPTFATVWVGNNDVLAPAISGQPGTATNQTTFVNNYSKIINQLVAGAPGIKGVLIGVVQVAGTPVMVAGPAFANPAFGAGINQATNKTVFIDPGCATSTSLIGFPIVAQIKAGTHPAAIFCSKQPSGLGDIFVLDAAEQAQTAAIVTGYNNYIKAKADSIGFAYYDPNPSLAAVAAKDPILATHVPNIGSATAPFGQYFTLDGVHPSATAHILIANDIITVINTKYGTSLLPAG
jgi:lysophospholipase L1-like esterase